MGVVKDTDVARRIARAVVRLTKLTHARIKMKSATAANTAILLLRVSESYS